MSTKLRKEITNFINLKIKIAMCKSGLSSVKDRNPDLLDADELFDALD